MANYEYLDHTGELAVKVQGKDLPSLFVNAAEAMNEYLSEGTRLEKATQEETLDVAAPDDASLLVAWLSEILYRIEVNHKIYTDYEILELTRNALQAKITGQPIKKLARDIKAVTHHNLAIEKVEEGYEVMITFDI